MTSENLTMQERMTKEKLLKFKKWKVKDTCQYLTENRLGNSEIQKFQEYEITGDKLQELTVDKLKELGISEPECLQILNALKKLWQIQSKVFNDPIHGHVELHPLLVKIIDTPQFQRLRYLKQLGGGYYVYPGASHNRFEHSIGVAHLAGELAQALQTRQPDLEITDRDILCVQIAGLCHDLGHGPFSHLYDGIVIPETEKKGWKHEDGSVKMFDHLVEKNYLKGVMEEHGLIPNEDLIFIKEMINGPLDNQAAEGELQYKGREKEKWFLYEIVANKGTGIDVDKFDYFARDCHHLGIRNNFDHQRFIKFARVCEVAGKKHICTRDKEEYNMYEMFHTRLSLHKRAYQHKTHQIIQHMIAEAFLKADEHIKIQGSGGKIYTLSTAIDDMEAYTKLTDHVFEQILNPISVELKETVETNDTEDSELVTVEEKEPKKPNELEVARGILKRIVSRDFYKFLGEWTMDEKPKPPSVTGQQVTLGSASKLEHLSIKEMEGTWKKGLAAELQLNSKDFVVSAVTLDYGMKDQNPMKNVHFYRKNDHTKEVEDSTEVSKLLPTCFSETMIRVYCKKTTDSSLDDHKDLFKKWCTNNSSKSIWKEKKQQPPTTSSS